MKPVQVFPVAALIVLAALISTALLLDRAATMSERGLSLDPSASESIDASATVQAALEPPVRSEVLETGVSAQQAEGDLEPVAAITPREPLVGLWASHDPRVERNARGRAEMMARCEADIVNPDTSAAFRTKRLRNLATLAVYTIEDFEGNSVYAEVRHPEPEPGFRTSSNGGALYHIPHGKYAPFDQLDSRNEARHEVTRADLEQLVSRANALLEPYAGQ